jgi:two-component system sensor histidine kinase BaeS
VKFSIASRLFLAVLLTSLLVAAGGLWMLRTSTERGFARYVAQVELARMTVIADGLVTVYSRDGQWPSLAEDERRGWLRQQMLQLRNGSPGRTYGGMAGGRQPPANRPPPQDMQGPPPEQLYGPGPGYDNPPRGPNFGNTGGPPEDGAGNNPPDGPPGGPGNGPQGRPPQDRLGLLDRAGLTDAAGNYIAGLPAPADTPRRAISVNNAVVGYLTLTHTTNPDDDIARAFLADQTRNLLIIIAVCIGLSALAAALLAAHFRKPIRQLAVAAETLAEGHFDTRLDIARSDELGDLAQSVNQLAAMLEQHERARRQWVADTSHELRTPVTVLRMQIEAVLDGVRKPDTALFTGMQRQIATLGKLINDLYLLAQADVNQLACQFETLDPRELAEAAADAFRERLQAVGLSLVMESSTPPLQLASDAARLHQIVGNLLENSLRYTDAGGCVRLSTEVRNQEWILHVDDSAPGVPPAALARLGERFYRIEQSRSRAHGGSGLGLALCQRIATALGGRLEFSASPLGGLRVSLYLPLRAAT